jgi:2-iminobutanoate/2-iminopropanoate deaminase
MKSTLKFHYPHFRLFIFFVLCAVVTGIGFAPKGAPPNAEKKIIATDKAPKAIGPYSQGVLVGDMLFVAGQLGIDPATGKFSGDSTEAQTRQSLRNIGEILKAAGFDYKDVVQSTVYLKDLNDFQRLNAVYGEYFSADPPSRATVEVARLPRDARVEIVVVAMRTAR